MGQRLKIYATAKHYLKSLDGIDIAAKTDNVIAKSISHTNVLLGTSFKLKNSTQCDYNSAADFMQWSLLLRTRTSFTPKASFSPKKCNRYVVSRVSATTTRFAQF